MKGGEVGDGRARGMNGGRVGGLAGKRCCRNGIAGLCEM